MDKLIEKRNVFFYLSKLNCDLSLLEIKIKKYK